MFFLVAPPCLYDTGGLQWIPIPFSDKISCETTYPLLFLRLASSVLGSLSHCAVNPVRTPGRLSMSLDPPAWPKPQGVLIAQMSPI